MDVPISKVDTLVVSSCIKVLGVDPVTRFPSYNAVSRWTNRNLGQHEVQTEPGDV
jgi:hypothetical protein